MLVITRSNGESIHIGDDITLRVLGVNGGQVGIGIDAPCDVSVYRQEIYRRIRAKNDLA